MARIRQRQRLQHVSPYETPPVFAIACFSRAKKDVRNYNIPAEQRPNFLGKLEPCGLNRGYRAWKWQNSHYTYLGELPDWSSALSAIS